jgi:hypothetical protein
LMWLEQQLIIWSFHGLFAQMWNEMQRCKKELHASLLTMNFSTTAVQGVLYNSHQALPTHSTPFKKPCPVANSYTSDDKTWTSTLAPVPTTFTLCPLEGKLSIRSSVQLDSQTFCSILIWCMSLSFLTNPCRALLYHVANFVRKGWLISTTMMTTVALGSSTFGCINSKSWLTTYHFLMDALAWWWTWWNAIVFNWPC